MNKISIFKIPFLLKGDIIKAGEKLDFIGKDLDNNDWELNKLKGKKIISVFPGINTRLCDMQTKEISRIASLYPHVNIVSVTMDSVEVIRQWCQARAITNLTIISDKQYMEFAKATNLYIKKIKKLARAFILLDENNKVVDISIKQEVGSQPNFDKLHEWIKEL